MMNENFFVTFDKKETRILTFKNLVIWIFFLYFGQDYSSDIISLV